MINIPLLHWAADTINDSRFTYMAMDHADTLMKYTVRDDGSCNHIIVLDPTNGELLETPGGQATVACYLRKNIFRIMAKNAHLSITKIIKNKQVDPLFWEDL